MLLSRKPIAINSHLRLLSTTTTRARQIRTAPPTSKVTHTYQNDLNPPLSSTWRKANPSSITSMNDLLSVPLISIFSSCRFLSTSPFTSNVNLSTKFYHLSYSPLLLLTSSSKIPSTYHLHKHSTTSTTSTDFKLVYKFPYIKAARSLCRLKIYQTTVTCLAVPIVAFMTYTGTVTSMTLALTIGTNVLALVMLGVMGEAFRKLVGHLYVSCDESQVKISHLTFWGGRHDLLVPADDLVPLSDLPDNPTDLYVWMKRYSDVKSGSSLILCLRFGGVVDEARFYRVFGKNNE